MAEQVVVCRVRNLVAGKRVQRLAVPTWRVIPDWITKFDPNRSFLTLRARPSMGSAKLLLAESRLQLCGQGWNLPQLA
jgi:hypothetical protein